MRIISGFLKGRTINFLKNPITRPLKDMVRENIFNILIHSSHIKTKVDNSKILDLYSGIGSFGIECISRGAKEVTFFDQDKKAVDLLEKNLINLSIINKSKIFNSNIEEALINVKDKFDIIFLDPPFKDTKFIQNLETIKKNKIFSSNHVVIIHREHKTNDNLNDNLKIVETKQYGRSKIIFGVFN